MWVLGDGTSAPIPADAAALIDGGPRFLTDAFRRFGSLPPTNEVTAITECVEVVGGSTGRKLTLTVAYRRPGPQTELFVKFSRDPTDPARDHGRTQMAPEVAFATLSTRPGFPITVPTTMFADYQRESGTGILVTERITFGRNGIEPQHVKCADYDMDDQLGHYRALFTAVARLAAADRAGAITHDLGGDAPAVGDRPNLDADRLHRRLDRLTEFASDHPGLLPANVRTASFLSGLHDHLPRLLAAEARVSRELGAHPELVALCHWNANVDNAWFWRDADGTLRCGLLDWGGVGPMNVAMAVWGAMSGAETAMWDDHLPELCAAFGDEFVRSGGGSLDVDRMIRHVLLYASVMGMTWLLDVPAHVRSAVPGLSAATTRMDAAIRDVESVRCRLQMLTNVLNLWETHGLGQMLDSLET
ncbi:hypothetical protein [Mycolicibacterium sediminis]|uniref:Aminoglycoside phosphotransferase n=1 Tax=Mycolicibacterium sediminis TaxID=1286180 RepID=A0A7I7QXD2_9MYCO|nr:hypothetical protein [Mycolicibacterium sediminis]BBY31004.1 hypothetical protein MSEDJ_51000 [Mycolicibacterium sediminis]